MEAQFINHLLTQMRKTVPENEQDSSSMDYYKSLIDKEYSEIASKTNGGLGIKKLILDQIYPQHLRGNHNIKMRQASNPKQAIKEYRSPDLKGGRS